MNTSARLTTLTRLGFVARGLLYLVIGVLILQSGRTEDPSGALDYLADGGGGLLLVLMAAGFIAYGIWRLSDAIFNIEGHEAGNKGMRERAGAAGSGIVHLALAWQAVRLIRGSGDSGGGSQESAQATLALPGGQLMLIIAGLALIGVAIFQIVKAAKGDYLRHLEPQVASQPWAKWTGRLGYGARGLVFLISGYFLLKAGLAEQAGEAGGIKEALAWLTDPWDVLVAIGLIGFGIYCLIEARYRIIHDVPVGEIADRAVHPHRG
jgi:membrane protease YdiL (CAAX protease family)